MAVITIKGWYFHCMS